MTATIRSRGVVLTERATPCDLVVHRGEIVGLIGLDGQGQDRFIRVLAGVDRPIAGTVEARHHGGEWQAIRTAKRAFRLGVVYLPRDRRGDGILPTLSVLDNFRILAMPRRARFGIVSNRDDRRRLGELVDRLSIRCAGLDVKIPTLSGGNQQKVLLARLLDAEPRTLLLHDPTRGVDHPTTVALYTHFAELARDNGATVVVLSSDATEIVEHCDRGVVFHRGGIEADLSGDELTHDGVLAAMFGERPQPDTGSEGSAVEPR